MKMLMRTLLRSTLLLGLMFAFAACPGGKDKEPNPIESAVTLTSAEEISKVMVVPGAKLEQGSPPAENNISAAPTVTTPTPEVSAISGQDMYVTFNYSNAVSNITYIYIQLVGTNSYFKIPINQNTGSNGTINIPIRIPENKIIPNCSSTTYEAFFLTANGACRKVGGQRKCFTSNLKPVAGKGKATINGQTYDATAVCGLDFAPYGTGYGISIGNSQFIIFYNMSTGGNVLGDFIEMSENSYDVPKSPFALYFDGTNVFVSKSGVASVNGGVVSTTLTVQDLFEGGRNITLSASGNCQ